MLRCFGLEPDSESDNMSKEKPATSPKLRTQQPGADEKRRKSHIYTSESIWKKALHNFKGIRVHSLNRDTAAYNKALYIHQELQKDGYIKKLVLEHQEMRLFHNSGEAWSEPVFVYMGSSHGETIFAIALDKNGKNLGILYEKNICSVGELWQSIRNGFDYCHAIRSVILFDTFYAYAKLKNCPTLPECSNIAKSWDNDFNRFFESEISYEPIGFNKCQTGFLGSKKSSDLSFLVLNKFNTNKKANSYFNIKKDTVSYIENNTLVQMKPSDGEVLRTYLISVLDIERVVELIHSSSESNGL
jgi:hypothetical protein